MRDERYRWAIGYAVLAAILFVLLMLAADRNPYLPGDVAVTRAVQAFHSPWLDTFMVLVSLPGSPPQTLVVNVLVVLIVLLCGMRAEALTLAIFIPLFGTIGTWIRCGIDRSRPTGDLVRVLDPLKDRGCSFPSGHTANFIILMGFLIFVGLTRLPPSWHRNLLLSLYGLFIVLQGISRIYVGDHWPSDVLGGSLIGTVFLVAMVLFYEWVRNRRATRVTRSRRYAGP